MKATGGDAKRPVPSFRRPGSRAFAQGLENPVAAGCSRGPEDAQTRDKVPSANSQWTFPFISPCSTPVHDYRQTGMSPRSTCHARLLIRERTSEILACVSSLPVLNPHPKSILYLAEARSSKYRGCALPGIPQSLCGAVCESTGHVRRGPINPASVAPWRWSTSPHLQGHTPASISKGSTLCVTLLLAIFMTCEGLLFTCLLRDMENYRYT